MKDRHRASGALVEVRDDKVMSPSDWAPIKEPVRKSTPRKRTVKSDDN